MLPKFRLVSQKQTMLYLSLVMGLGFLAVWISFRVGKASVPRCDFCGDRDKHLDKYSAISECSNFDASDPRKATPEVLEKMQLDPKLCDFFTANYKWATGAEEKCTSLSAELGLCKSEMERLKYDLKDCQNQVCVLESKNSSLIGDFSSLLAEHSEAFQKIHTLEQQLKDSGSQIYRKEKDLQASEASNQGLLSQSTILEKKIRSLEDQLGKEQFNELKNALEKMNGSAPPQSGMQVPNADYASKTLSIRGVYIKYWEDVLKQVQADREKHKNLSDEEGKLVEQNEKVLKEQIEAMKKLDKALTETDTTYNETFKKYIDEFARRTTLEKESSFARSNLALQEKRFKEGSDHLKEYLGSLEKLTEQTNDAYKGVLDPNLKEEFEKLLEQVDSKSGKWKKTFEKLDKSFKSLLAKKLISPHRVGGSTNGVHPLNGSLNEPIVGNFNVLSNHNSNNQPEITSSATGSFVKFEEMVDLSPGSEEVDFSSDSKKKTDFLAGAEEKTGVEKKKVDSEKISPAETASPTEIDQTRTGKTRKAGKTGKTDLSPPGSKENADGENANSIVSEEIVSEKISPAETASPTEIDQTRTGKTRKTSSPSSGPKKTGVKFEDNSVVEESKDNVSDSTIQKLADEKKQFAIEREKLNAKQEDIRKQIEELKKMFDENEKKKVDLNKDIEFTTKRIEMVKNEKNDHGN